MRFIGGLIRPEMDWGFLLFARMEMHRTYKKDSFAALYSNAEGWETERDFMVMYLMGGEI